MPWKECHVVEERLRFIARLLDGEKMAGLCREFGISRKTGYKIYDRYQDCGLDGLTDRSRRPYRHANQLPMQVEKAPAFVATPNSPPVSRIQADAHEPDHRGRGVRLVGAVPLAVRRIRDHRGRPNS